MKMIDDLFATNTLDSALSAFQRCYGDISIFSFYEKMFAYTLLPKEDKSVEDFVKWFTTKPRMEVHVW